MTKKKQAKLNKHGYPYDHITTRNDEEWAALRQTGIGGSDAGAICGLNPYVSPLVVWLEKTGREAPPDLSDNQSVEWGTRLESVVAKKFADEHPELKVLKYPDTMRSIEYPYMLANIDRGLIAADSTGVLEIKTARDSGAWEDGVPAWYYAQVCHYLAVTGYDFAWVAVLIRGSEYREYYIRRDQADIDSLIRLEGEFWQMVQEGTMPAIIGLSDESQALSRLYQQDDGQIGLLDDGAIVSAIGDYMRAAERIKDLEDGKLKASNTIKAAIGGCKGLENDLLKVTWTRSEKRDSGIRITVREG